MKFTQKGNLNKHMKVHDNTSIENRKVFKCDYCDKSYTEKFNLNVSCFDTLKSHNFIGTFEKA